MAAIGGGALALITSLSPTALAQAENGDWHINAIDAPARLIEGYYNSGTDGFRSSQDSSDSAQPGEQLVDTFFPGPTDFTSAGIALNNGTITGAFPGTYSIGNLGKVSINADGEALTGYINTPHDTMILPSGSVDSLTFNVLTRLPAALATADLEGTWKVIVLDLPDDLTESYYKSSDGSDRQAKASDPVNGFAVDGEQLVDTYFYSNPEQQILTISIDAAGNITGDIGGTATANGDKSVSINIGDTLVFHPNAAVDVMTHVGDDPAAELFTKILMVKLPSSPAVADLQGVWRAQWLDFPTYLTESYYNSGTEQSRTSSGPSDFAQPGEQLVDTYFINPPELGTELVTISAAGAVSGSASGSISTSGNFFVFNPAAAADPNINFYPNASGTVMIGEDSNADALNLITFVKVAVTEPAFEELVDLQTSSQPGSMSFSWESASTFVLVQADSLDGPWEVVPGTAGTSSHTVDTSLATKKFFRVQVLED